MTVSSIRQLLQQRITGDDYLSKVEAEELVAEANVDGITDDEVALMREIRRNAVLSGTGSTAGEKFRVGHVGQEVFDAFLDLNAAYPSPGDFKDEYKAAIDAAGDLAPLSSAPDATNAFSYNLGEKVSDEDGVAAETAFRIGSELFLRKIEGDGTEQWFNVGPVPEPDPSDC